MQRCRGGGPLEDTPTILVVEDEMMILHMIEMALGDGGFKVIPAATGERAVQILDASQSPIRAIVTDIKLGSGMSGWDVAKHARQINPDIGVIYVTGHGEDEWPTLGLPKSVLIPKPFVIAQLLTAVSNLVTGKSK